MSRKEESVEAKQSQEAEKAAAEKEDGALKDAINFDQIHGITSVFMSQEEYVQSLTLDALLRDCADVYLADTTRKANEPEAIANELVQITNKVIELHDMGVAVWDDCKRKYVYPNAKPSRQRYGGIDNLEPIQVAGLINHFYEVRSISTLGSTEKTSDDLLGVKYPDGDKYETDTQALLAIVRPFLPNGKQEVLNRVLSILCDLAKHAQVTDEKYLTPYQNGVFDYRSRELRIYSPDDVFLSIIPHKLLLDEPEMPEYEMVDGTVCNLDEILQMYVTPENYVPLLRRLGACLRSGWTWRVRTTLYNEEGSNGKSTILGIAQSLVGENNFVERSLSDVCSRFGLARVIDKRLITTDDSTEGNYVRNLSAAKSLIAQQSLTIERKGVDAITAKPRIYWFAAANDFDKTSEKGAAWRDRQDFLPIVGRFPRGVRDEGIEDFLRSEPAMEWIIWKTQVDLEPYFELEPVAEAKALMNDAQVDNDSVYEFLSEGFDLDEDFYPLGYLYGRYRNWMTFTHPSASKVMSSRDFYKRVADFAREGDEFVVPVDKENRKQRLTVSRWTDEYFEVVDARSNPSYPKFLFHANTKNGEQALVRKSAWDFYEANGGKMTPHERFKLTVKPLNP